MTIRIMLAALFMLGIIPTRSQAQQYVYTNENLYQQTNTTTALKVGPQGQLKKIQRYFTGGMGTGSQSPGQAMIVAARVASGYCLFVANGGSDNIAGFSIKMTDGSLTTAPGSPYASGGGTPGNLTLALGPNHLLLAGDSQTIRLLRVNSDCSLTAPLSSYPVLGPLELKVTPNGKFLISTAFGPVETFAIDGQNATMTDLGTTFALGSTLGVEITCDSTTIYFGDAATLIEIEVFGIDSAGTLTELNNFNDTHGEDSSSVLLSQDEKTLYVGNNLSGQITAFSVGVGGSLTWGSTTTLNGSISTLLDLALSGNGKFLFAEEQFNPEAIGVVRVNGTAITEVPGSPFAISNNPFDPGIIVAVPGKTCRTGQAR